MAFGDLVSRIDRAALSHMGGPVRYSPNIGDPVDVTGIFDAAYVRAEVGDTAIVSSGPAVFLILADLPTDPEEDAPTITVGSTDYRVREPRKDGMGGVVLMLQEV